MNTKIVFSEKTQTFRLMPFNYWLASVKNDKLVFDSWDGATKDIFKKHFFLKLQIVFIFYLGKAKKINQLKSKLCKHL